MRISLFKAVLYLRLTLTPDGNKCLKIEIRGVREGDKGIGEPCPERREGYSLSEYPF